MHLVVSQKSKTWATLVRDLQRGFPGWENKLSEWVWGWQPSDDTLFSFPLHNDAGLGDTLSIWHSCWAHLRCFEFILEPSGICYVTAGRHSLDLCVQIGEVSCLPHQIFHQLCLMYRFFKNQLISYFEVQMLALINVHLPVLLDHRPQRLSLPAATVGERWRLSASSTFYRWCQSGCVQLCHCFMTCK